MTRLQKRAATRWRSAQRRDRNRAKRLQPDKAPPTVHLNPESSLRPGSSGVRRLVRLEAGMETMHTILERFAVEAHRNAQLNDLTDAQLAELLLNDVWANLSSLTPEATLVGQAIDRLRRSNGGPLSPDAAVTDEDARLRDDLAHGAAEWTN